MVWIKLFLLEIAIVQANELSPPHEGYVWVCDDLKIDGIQVPDNSSTIPFNSSLPETTKKLQISAEKPQLNDDKSQDIDTIPGSNPNPLGTALSSAWGNEMRALKLGQFLALLLALV